MSLDKPYLSIPGTTVFDADLARKGYHLNSFCMSLMKADNRTRFKANERAYLDEWPMTEEQKQGATDGKSFQHAAALMTGMSQDAYAKMMLSGGRSPNEGGACMAPETK